MFTVHVDDGAMTRLPGEWQRFGGARRAAIAAARTTGAAILVCTEGPRVRARYLPDGNALPPADAIADPRNVHRSEGACFCVACRADRRAAR